MVLVWLRRRWKCQNGGARGRRSPSRCRSYRPRARLTARLREHAAHLVGGLGVPLAVAAGESVIGRHPHFTSWAEAGSRTLGRPGPCCTRNNKFVMFWSVVRWLLVIHPEVRDWLHNIRKADRETAALIGRPSST